MFDRYCCIKLLKENEPLNLYFLWLKACGNGTFTACVLKTPLPGQIGRRLFTFAAMHAMTLTSLFMTALECIQLKQQSRFITAHESLCYVPHRRGGGHIVFGADPVGVCVGVTLSCLHDIS